MQKDLDVVMAMQNLLEYRKNYRYRDERTLNYDNPPTVNDNADPITNSDSFK